MGYLSERVIPAIMSDEDDDALNQLKRLGYEIQDMSVEERAVAMIENGIKASTNFMNAVGSGWAGLGTLASGGSLDEAVSNMGDVNEASPLQFEIESKAGNKLSEALGMLSDPIEFGAKELGHRVLENTDSPEAATAAEVFSGMFLGRKAKNANLDKLKEAELMTKEGVHRNQVFTETGWFQDPNDQQWKFEISDKPMQLDTENLRGPAQFPRKSGDVIDHPELKENYPHLMNQSTSAMNIKAEELPGTIQGSYNSDMNLLKLDKGLSDQEMKSTALHELQHAIQKEEGFGQGGSPDRANLIAQNALMANMREHAPENASYETARRELGVVSRAKELAHLQDLSTRDGRSITPSMIHNRGDFYKHSTMIRSELGSMPKRSGYDQKEWLRGAAKIMHREQTKDIKSEYGGYEYDTDIAEKAKREPRLNTNEIKRIERRLDKHRTGARAYSDAQKKSGRLASPDTGAYDDLTDFETYQRLAGEAEARNVQNRLLTSDSENQYVHPMQTMTVAEKYGGGNKAIQAEDLFPSQRGPGNSFEGESADMRPDRKMIGEFDPRYDDRKLEQERMAGLNTTVTDTTPEVPEVSLADFEGRPIVTTMADRSGLGMLEGINDVDLKNPVELEAGQDYMFGKKAIESGEVWAQGKGADTNLMNAAKRAREEYGVDPIIAPWRMAPTGSDFATMSGKTLMAYAASALPKYRIAEVNKLIKKNIIPKFKGIGTPEGMQQYYDAPAEIRKVLIQLLDRDFRNVGGLSKGEMRLAISDPKQLTGRDTGMMNVGEIDTSRPVNEVSAHTTYDRGIPGQGLGRLSEADQGLSIFDVMPEMRKRRGLEMGQTPGPTDVYALMRSMPTGFIDEALLRALDNLKSR